MKYFKFLVIIFCSLLSLVVSISAKSANCFYVRDQLGSIVGTTASGALLNVKIERDAYGKEEALLGSTADAKYAPDMGYAGMYYHWASGFNLTPNRWYDSRTGRWLSRDPIAEAGGTNLYNYVGGNVLNYTDPSGEFAIPVGQCLVGAGAVIGGGPLGWVLGGAIIADAVVGSILNNSSDSGGGDKPASTPTGQQGSPLDVKPGTNEPTTIGDRDYTGHALDRMQGRGVPPSAVEDAIRNGTSRPGNRPNTTVHHGSNGVTVVTGSNGQVITVY